MSFFIVIITMLLFRSLFARLQKAKTKYNSQKTQKENSQHKHTRRRNDNCILTPTDQKFIEAFSLVGESLPCPSLRRIALQYSELLKTTLSHFRSIEDALTIRFCLVAPSPLKTACKKVGDT